MATSRPPAGGGKRSRRRASGAKAVAAAVLAGSLALTAAAGAGEDAVLLTPRPGVTMPVLFVAPERPPVASVILFPGGDGRHGVAQRGPDWGVEGNFLIRSRAFFAEQGFLAAVVDAPSDQPDGLWRARITEAHARDAAAVIGEARRRASGPVWLVGTSMGTISAANAAGRGAGGAGADGLVLTATVFRSHWLLRVSVRDVTLSEIRMPTLFVHHRQDGCNLTPFADIAPLMRQLTQAPRVDMLEFDGGSSPRSGPCAALSAHGFLGIEREVVGGIARWIKAASGLQ